MFDGLDRVLRLESIKLGGLPGPRPPHKVAPRGADNPEGALVREHDLLPVVGGPVEVSQGEGHPLVLHLLGQERLLGGPPRDQVAVILQPVLDGAGRHVSEGGRTETKTFSKLKKIKIKMTNLCLIFLAVRVGDFWTNRFILAI